jgi:protein involved in polysaccharide export with SLBB domain
MELKKITGWLLAVSGLFSLLCFAGCQSENPPITNPFGTAPAGIPGGTGGKAATNTVDYFIDRIEVGDEVTVTYSDYTPQLNPSIVTVTEDGTITLMYDKKFVAAGKNINELQAEIRKAYVPDYFVALTVNVKISTRFFVVEGEAKIPGKYPYVSKTTVLGAIATAGGFTDYAKRWDVMITRKGETLHEDCDKARNNPKLDREIFPGDKIFVPKRVF